MTKIEDFRTLFDTLTIYKGVLDDFVLCNFRRILDSIKNEEDIEGVVQAWSSMTGALYNKEYQGDWSQYIKNLILFDNNYFTNECAKGRYDVLNQNIKDAAISDINILLCLMELELPGI